MAIIDTGTYHLQNQAIPLAGGKAEAPPKSGADFSTYFEKALDKTVGETSGGMGASKTSVDKTSKLYEQCEALESFVVKILLSSMRNTVQKSGLINEGFAGQMYEDMLYDEYAKDLTKNSGFGLAEVSYLELTGQRGILPA